MVCRYNGIAKKVIGTGLIIICTLNCLQFDWFTDLMVWRLDGDVFGECGCRENYKCKRPLGPFLKIEFQFCVSAWNYWTIELDKSLFDPSPEFTSIDQSYVEICFPDRFEKNYALLYWMCPTYFTVWWFFGTKRPFKHEISLIKNIAPFRNFNTNFIFPHQIKISLSNWSFDEPWEP